MPITIHAEYSLLLIIVPGDYFTSGARMRQRHTVLCLFMYTCLHYVHISTLLYVKNSIFDHTVFQRDTLLAGKQGFETSYNGELNKIYIRIGIGLGRIIPM